MEKLTLDRDWHFYLGDNPPNQGMNSDEAGWQQVNLPHDWSIGLERDPQQASGVAGGYFPTGRGWYRKSLDIPETWRGKKIWIEFEGVYMNSEVWLNGRFVGRHPYGYTSFHYDLTPYLSFGAENIVQVFVDNACQPNSRWYSGSGIYRHVWLHVGNPLHISMWGITISTPEVNSATATVAVHTRIENETSRASAMTVLWRILSDDGSTVARAELPAELNGGEKREFRQSMMVPNPRPWSLDDPALYRLETELLVAGQVLDSASTTFGIRSLEFDSKQGFRLNGQQIKLKGGCLHHDNGILGAASFDRAEERKVELLKASGFNALRCAHNPPAPAFLDACDRLGMLVIDEAFDCWRYPKNPGDYHTTFDDWWQRDIDSMVRRDCNHASIFLWSIGNEIPERGWPEGVELGHRLAGYVRSLDPSRLVTSAVCEAWQHEWDWPQTGNFFATLDVGGYNYQWAQYGSDHKLFPERVMLGTESFPIEAYENWMSVIENDWVIGDFVWTALDYLGESGIGRVLPEGAQDQGLGEYPWHQANCGDLDLCGFKRPQSYYRDVLWKDSATPFIAVHSPYPEGKTSAITRWGWPDVSPNWTWPGHEARIFTVDVYSASDEVELFLDDRSLGTKPAGKTGKYRATFQVAYQPGLLKAVGYRADRPAETVTLETSGEPARIRLSPDRSAILVGGSDLSYVTVEVVDSRGNLCQQSMHPIDFTVQGAGKILAAGSADPANTENYTGSRHKVFHGRSLVVLISGQTPGDLCLMAKADGLEDGEVVLQTIQA